MATGDKKQPMERQMKTGHTVLRHPLNVIVEKFGDGNARVCGEMSKESLRDLLMPSLTHVRILPTTETDKDKERVEQQVQTEIREKDDSARERHFRRRPKQFNAELSPSARRKKHRKLRRQREKKEERIEGLKEIGQKETLDKVVTSFDDYYDGRSWGWSEYGERSFTETSRSLLSCPSSDWESALLPHDEKWLRRNIVRPLRIALREIVVKKPSDPVGFLSFWLLNYRKSQEYAVRERQYDDLLQMERALLVKVPIADAEKQSIEIRKVEEVIGEWH